ncbi:MAG: hypothetical protein FWG11_08125 [Promicromonosporaceae bacterium]|nr:hypothetical protein [Promicromonosporaceae bacterium]
MLTQDQATEINAIWAQAGSLSRAWLFDSAPHKQLRNAIKTFGEGVPRPDEQLVLLHDDTVFGSGRNGLIITSRRVLYRGMGSSTETIDVDHVSSVVMVPGSIATKVEIGSLGGRAITAEIHFPSDTNENHALGTAVERILRVVCPLLSAPNQQQAWPPPAWPAPGVPAENLAGSCPACGATGGGARFCEYCGTSLVVTL